MNRPVLASISFTAVLYYQRMYREERRSPELFSARADFTGRNGFAAANESDMTDTNEKKSRHILLSFFFFFIFPGFDILQVFTYSMRRFVHKNRNMLLFSFCGFSCSLIGSIPFALLCTCMFASPHRLYFIIPTSICERVNKKNEMKKLKRNHLETGRNYREKQKVENKYYSVKADATEFHRHIFTCCSGRRRRLKTIGRRGTMALRIVCITGSGCFGVNTFILHTFLSCHIDISF